MPAKKSFFILLCLAALLAVNQAALAFSIDPSRIELVIAAGRQKGAMITIDNSQSDEPVHIKVYLQDITYLASGDYDFLPPGSTAWSCAKWITVMPEELDIPPGRKENVRLSVALPPEAHGGYYAIAFFESSPSYTTIDGLGINFRIGALVDITVKNTEERKARLTNLAFNEPQQIEVSIFNEGNLLIRPKGRIRILDAQGKKRVKQLNFNPQAQSILPDTLRKFYVELDEPLANGQYQLRAEIDYGTKYLLIGERSIEVK